MRHGSPRAHLELREQLEAVPERLAEGPDFVLHAVLDFIVDGYAPLLDKLEEMVGEMEDHAVARFPDQARIRRIFRLRRELRRFEDIAGRMEEVAAKLAEVEQPAIDKRARPYFRDVLDNTRRAVTPRALAQRHARLRCSRSPGLLEQSRQGAITRQLAAWAAILAVPTAIAGIYGMNFEYMPELEWRYGYFIVLGVDRRDLRRAVRALQADRLAVAPSPACGGSGWASRATPHWPTPEGEGFRPQRLRRCRRSASGQGRRGRGRRRIAAAVRLGRLDGVVQQAGDGHRADAAGHRGDRLARAGPRRRRRRRPASPCRPRP